LYDEYGRHTLAMRGEQTVLRADGTRQTQPLAEAAGEAWFRLEDWHEYHLICNGGHLRLLVDGRLAAEVQDDDPRRGDPQGILALQLHSGPATVVQFKDIRLKVLRPAEPRDTQDVSLVEWPADLRRELVARWPLDTGGHGATPPLRHVPAFEQFELNVRPVGRNAPPGRVVTMDGAHFEAQPGLLTGSDWTILLRAADPRGQWHGVLWSAAAANDRAYFELLGQRPDGADGAGGAESSLMARLKTDRATAQVAVPTAQLGAETWHDLVVRYADGSLALFVDGRLISQQACDGDLSTEDVPVWIAARRGSDGAAVDPFRGELQLAAIWARGLSEAEISRLSVR
jgi:hypothetical protein